MINGIKFGRWLSFAHSALRFYLPIGCKDNNPFTLDGAYIERIGNQLKLVQSILSPSDTTLKNLEIYGLESQFACLLSPSSKYRLHKEIIYTFSNIFSCVTSITFENLNEAIYEYVPLCFKALKEICLLNVFTKNSGSLANLIDTFCKAKITHITLGRFDVYHRYDYNSYSMYGYKASGLKVLDFMCFCTVSVEDLKWCDFSVVDKDFQMKIQYDPSASSREGITWIYENNPTIKLSYYGEH